VEAGVFGDKPRVFLWRGQIVEWVGRTPIGRRHVFAVNALGAFLRRFAPPGFYVEQGLPVAIGDDCLKDVDLKFVRGEAGDYRTRAPGVHDVPLIVEVLDADLSIAGADLSRAYAAAVVPVYWVVNLPDHRIEVYTRPSGPTEEPRFEACRVFGRDDEVPVLLNGREVGRIPVREVLP
jgi:hypothetical protein